MARTDATWNVLPHKPLQKLEENLWTITGSLTGMPLERVMTIARLGDGRLVIHNAMALEEPLMKEIEAFGKPAFILVPNAFHRIDAPRFKHRYPDAQVLCPEGAKKKVEEVVDVQGTYDSLPADDRVKLHYLDGVAHGEGYLEVRSERGVSLVFNDVMFNTPHQPGVSGFVMRLIGSTGGPKVTRVAKLFLVKDKRALKTQLEALAETANLIRVVVMHGDTAEGPAAPALLRQVAATL